jgi:hypothetical protein
MPGIDELIVGAMQQAPQPGLQASVMAQLLGR